MFAPLDESWDALISGLPSPHILQTREWALVKGQFGWQPMGLSWPGGMDKPWAASLVLERSLAFGGLRLPLRVLYSPKGPLMDWRDAALRARVLDGLQQLAHQRGAVFIKIDPDVTAGCGLPSAGQEDPTGSAVTAELAARGWLFSPDQIQFRNTMVIDLSPDEDQLLARMKPKMRYNVRLAERKGVRVRTGGEEDLALLHQMYAETALRDGFVIREEVYYRAVWSAFLSAGMAQALIAEVEGEPVAAVLLFVFGERAWYLYGMSRAAHREKMPNALLQWEAICRAKAAGCRTYDLWGAPDEFGEGDSMWGLYRFKEGLGAEVVRHIGAWDYPARPNLYRLYTQVIPRILNIMRRRGMQEMQHRIQPT